MKQRIFMVLAIFINILVPLTAQSESDFEVSQNADNTLTITGYNGRERNVVIPDTLYGLKVTIIGQSAFQNKRLTSVVIPDTVITIANGRVTGIGRDTGAFSHNKELTSVIFGKGLKTIGNNSFCDTGLTEIIIPNSVTSINGEAFRGSKLAKVTFGTGLQTIG